MWYANRIYNDYDEDDFEQLYLQGYVDECGNEICDVTIIGYYK